MVWDILNVLHRRFPLVNILIYPVAVQGQSVGKDIARAIRTLNRLGASDVLILARGEGPLRICEPLTTSGSLARCIVTGFLGFQL